MNRPPVSIICICRNHDKFVREAVMSAMNQTHKPVEVIVVDDNSTDGSREIIMELSGQFPEILTKFLPDDSGICKSFNEGFSISHGEYIIDLSADDVLMPGRVEEGLTAFSELDDSFGVHFTDAEYIAESGEHIRNHYSRDKKGKLKKPVPQGALYTHLLSRYFICTPAMMIRRKVLEYLGGYDESLAYEDFDFWIRTSKKFRYCYTDKVLVKKRIVKDSLSSTQYAARSRMPESTLKVCLKAEKLSETEADKKALVKRARYEFRKCWFSRNRAISKGYLEIICRNSISPAERTAAGIIRKMV